MWLSPLGDRWGSQASSIQTQLSWVRGHKTPRKTPWDQAKDAQKGATRPPRGTTVSSMTHMGTGQNWTRSKV